MKYSIYELLSNKLARAYRKGHNLPKKTKNLKQKAISYMANNIPQILQSMDMLVLFDEFNLENRGNTIIFPEDEKLIQMMLKSKFTVSKASFRTPEEYLLFSFPDSFSFKGEKLPGCMFSFTSFENRKKDWDKFKEKHFPDKNADFTLKNPPPWFDKEEIDNFINLTYCKKDKHGNEAYYRCTIPDVAISEVLKSKQDLVDKLGSYEGYNFAFKLSEQEAELQYTILRICCGLCAYYIAFPESLVKGLPSGSGFKKGEFKGFVDAEIINAPRITRSHEGPSEPFYRIPHLRELAHPRFKRDEDGNVRIVPVSAAIIGADIVTPETIKRLKDKRFGKNENSDFS